MYEPSDKQLAQREMLNDNVRRRLKSRAVMTPYGGKAKLTAAQRMEVCYLRADGLTAKQIAVMFGISASYVSSFSAVDRP